MPLSCVQKSRSYWRRTRYSRPLQPRWSQGSTKAPTSSFPRNTVGYIQSGTCVFWTGPLSSSRSRCWRRDASFMRPSLRLGCSDRPERRLLPCLDPPSIPLCVQRGEHTSRPSPSGTSAGWGFRSTGKRANSPLCRGSLFSARSWTRSTSQHVSQRSVLSQCWDAWSLSSARGRFHWNIFRGSWGIWHPQPLSRRSDCFIWDRFSVGFTTESRDGHGATARTGSHSPRPAVAPSAHGRTLLSSGRSSPRASIQACCCFNRRLCHGLGGHVQRARSRRALDRAPAAVAYQLPRVAGSMASSAPLQNAATREAYTGPLGQHCDRCVHQSGLRSRRMSQLARHLLLWSQKHLRSLRAVHVPGELDRAADELSRQHALLGEWRLHPEVPQLNWRRFGDACLPGHVSLPVVFLPVRRDPRYRCTGMQLASGLTQICVSPSEPSRTDPVQGQGGRGASPLGCALLAQSDVVPRTDVPRDSPSLANSSEEGSTFSERGHPLAPAPRLVESPRMVLGRDAEVLSGLPPAVVNTITSATALSTRQAYRLKWNLFVDWCSPRREDPRRCPIAVVLSFLQDGLERRLSPSTLKVYVAAIAAHHDAVDGKSLGKHDLVIRFLRGARRLNPPRPHLVPSWDLPSVLAALRGAPFEPLQSVELKFLSLKTVLLSALATVKRVGDLQAFSVDDSCLEFGPADSHVVLRPRPGYVPKVPTMPFRDQVVNLQALPREEADPAIALLCPVRALRIYVDRTQSFRTSDQLFVCFGGQQKGRAVSKQRLAHWIVEAIVLAYQARRLPCPLGVRAHSTRGVASSWALARGASIADICKAAGWATPNTFARFYNLRIEPVSSRVLVSDGQ